jgi:hypothetical protein
MAFIFEATLGLGVWAGALPVIKSALAKDVVMRSCRVVFIRELGFGIWRSGVITPDQCT